MSSTPESQYPTISIQGRSETQLYTVRVPETSKPKRWVSLGLWLLRTRFVREPDFDSIGTPDISCTKVLAGQYA